MRIFLNINIYGFLINKTDTKQKEAPITHWKVYQNYREPISSHFCDTNQMTGFYMKYNAELKWAKLKNP